MDAIKCDVFSVERICLFYYHAYIMCQYFLFWYMILSSYIKFQKQFKITNKLEQIAIKDKRGKIVSFDVGFNLRHPFSQ